MQQITDVYCDVHGLLAQFFEEACLAFGCDPAGIEAGSMRRVSKVWEPLGVTEQEFWARIDALGPGFWADLAPTPERHMIIERLVRLRVPLHLASAPRETPAAISGTGAWCDRWAKHGPGCVFTKRHLRSDKSGLAQPGRLLIDDYEAHVEAWRQCGGEAILWPSIRNANRDHAHCAQAKMLYLRDALAELEFVVMRA